VDRNIPPGTLLVVSTVEPAQQGRGFDLHARPWSFTVKERQTQHVFDQIDQSQRKKK